MKLFNYISYITLVLAFGVLLIVGYWLFYPYKVLEVKDDIFRVNTKTVKTGGNLEYVVNYCKYLDIKATTTRIFKNGLVFYMPSFEGNIPQGCHQTTFIVPIPKELPAGKYYLEVNRSFEVNPLRKINVITRTEEFEVVE